MHKFIKMPFGITAIHESDFLILKIQAVISRKSRDILMEKYANLRWHNVERKDGIETKACMFKLVGPSEQVFNCLREIRMAIIDEKISQLYDKRMKLLTNKDKHKKVVLVLDDDLPF